MKTKNAILVMVLILSGMELTAQTLELNNDTLHLKLDLTRGGAIKYISESGSTRNLVNIHDEGRYIQQSYYAGQALNRQADGQNPNWSPWSWNPIQVGDSYNNRAEILEQRIDGNTLYTRCIPMLWDMNNEPAEAEMEQWTTLTGNVIKVHNKLTCLRTDNIWTEGTNKSQELPAVYPISALKNLYSYFGSLPFSGGPLDNPEVEYLQNGFWGRYHHNMVTENWMAFVDDNHWGMGVYTPICDNFLAGMSGQPGGEALNGSTSYIAPVKTVQMYKSTVYEYDYWLVIGTLNQIRTEIYNLKGVQKNAWEFTDDLEGWNKNTIGGSVNQSAGNLEFTVSGDHPSVDNVVESWEPGELRYLWISIKNETAGDSGAFHFFSNAGYIDSVQYPLTPNDTEYRNVVLDLDTLDFWSADTTYGRFRFRPVSGNEPGTARVGHIRFLESLIRLRTDEDVNEINGLGNSLQLYAETIPEMNTANVDWSSYPPEIVSVSSSGYLTALAEGIVTVTATARVGSAAQASIAIEIIDDTQRASWEFLNDVEGWDENPHACTVSHSEGALKVTVQDGDPYVVNNVAPWEVGSLKYLWMRVRNETKGKGGAMYLFPSGGGHDFVPFHLLPEDTAFRDVFVDMRNAEKWDPGLVIESLRLDANNGGELGDICFDFIRFREDLVAVTGEGGATEIAGLGNTLQLYAKVLIDTDHPIELEWSVDSSGVAIVDQNGQVTSVKEGQVVVTASDKEGSGIIGEMVIDVNADHTSIHKVQTNQITIYPNPARSVLYIANSSAVQSATLFSTSGRMIRNYGTQHSPFTLDIEFLIPGIYFLQTISKEGDVAHYQLVKE